MDLSQFSTVSGASRVTGVARSTIRSGIDRGAIGYYKLGCGTEVVDLEEVKKAWPGLVALREMKTRKLKSKLPKVSQYKSNVES